jgi:hypothetical protein
VISDGRLDLDEAGRVVDDAPGESLVEVVEDGLDRDLTSRALAWFREHRGLRVASAAGLAATLGVGAWLAGRPAPVAPLSSAVVVPVPVADVLVGRDRLGRSGVVTAAYDVAAGAHGSVTTVSGVEGPGIRAWSVRVVSESATGQRVVVSAVPDCAETVTLDSAPTDYRLLLSRTDADGRSASGTTATPGTALADGVRRTCWTLLGSSEVMPSALDARIDAHLDQLVLSVTMTNASARGVRLGAIDIADVSTIDPADTQVLAAGTSRVIRVRLPSTVCGAVRAPTGLRAVGSTLTWAIGPPSGQVEAVVSTAVPQALRARISEGLDHLCGASPSVLANVTAATLLPTSPFVTDRNSISLRLRVQVHSDAQHVVAGDDPAVLTSDARPTFTADETAVGRSGAAVDVVWSTRCATTTAPRLPVALLRDGHEFRTSVSIANLVVAQAFSAACATDPTTVLAQWLRGA